MITYRVYYDEEIDEYQVQYIENGILNIDNTYFTDDKEDALDTLKAMVREELDGYVQEDKD